jgi:glycosyltransferase involved in cell wall biosynthesis
MTGPANAILADAPGRSPAHGIVAPLGERGGRLPKMRVLHALSSTNQLYSGVGRNLFELVARLSDRIIFEFAIDDHVSKNVDLLRRFCDRHGFVTHVGKARISPESLDVLNEDLPGLLGQDRWEVIECLCWANASTNAAVLENLGDAILGYTPHDQPISSVPMSTAQAVNTRAVHERVLRRADVIFCDSGAERRRLELESGGRGKCLFLPIGCDLDDFRPGPTERAPQLLFVGDAAEPRKRIDRILAVFGRLRQRHPQLRLIFIGNKSDRVRELIPIELQSACELRGYVDEAELRRAYAESLGLFLLSDCEAFGIPILEALASGTPVFLSRLDETRSLFGSYPAAHFCPADDLDGTLDVIERTLARGTAAIREAIDSRESLRAAFDWDVIATDKWRSLGAAWYQKCKNRLAF